MGCFQPRPTRQSIYFGGRFINLSAIARTQHIDLSYLSRIMAGNRRASVDRYAIIARALEMTIEDLLAAIDQRAQMLIKERVEIGLKAFDQQTDPAA